MTATVLIVTAALLFLCTMASAAVWTRFYRLRHKPRPDEITLGRLVKLAERSLESLDVPVGALLVYRGDIIGEGYNTVLRNSAAGEHAEMNAISDAMRRLGMEAFNALDRKSLVLISTFEPCLMCVGALVNYNIRYVRFLKEKDLHYLAAEGTRSLRYVLLRRKYRDGGEQEALFERHPFYPLKRGIVSSAGSRSSSL